MASIVSVSPRALRDIDRAVQNIAEYVSEPSSERWYVGLEVALRSLAENPERCPQAEEADALGLDLRELLYGRKRQTYRVLFTIDGPTVNIHRVRHAAQNWLTDDDL